MIGSTEEVREHFHAISVERKISHPTVAAITETAHALLKSDLIRGDEIHNRDSSVHTGVKRSL